MMKSSCITLFVAGVVFLALTGVANAEQQNTNDYGMKTPGWNIPGGDRLEAESVGWFIDTFDNSAGTNIFSCLDDPNSRQFDFWVGNWDVFVKGEKVSESHIERTLNGCMIMENYTSLRTNYSGKSMNFFDRKLEMWVQIWTDTQGNVSRYRGELRDGKMYFKGTNTARDGKESLVRMEFTPNPDGSVRQVYEQSTDGGKTWKVQFDGIYRAKSSGM